MNIKELREKNRPVESTSITDKTREFYQSKKWRSIREAYRKKKRAEHEEIVFQVYQDNLNKNKPEDLIEFLTDPKKYPLSELSLQRGVIRRATVCDHIIERRKGGSDKESNLQWLTREEHKDKTQREMQEE